MTDALILALLQERSEEAVAALSERYGPYCRSIAMSVLGDAGAAEECLNDTWFAVWRRIPPELPRSLRAFCGRITRRRAIDRLRQAGSLKRGGGELPLVLDELSEVVPGHADVEKAIEQKELAAAIEGFLDTLPERTRRIFVCRYWYADPVRDIAKVHGMKENAVSMLLSRTREKLRKYLTERGFDL